jgi:(R,R)-butanediol dehydrogenase/meso-butanediol dehydrogenase/diacetyl reductase
MVVRETPEPVSKPGHVIVRTHFCAICLTDVANYDGLYPLPATDPRSYPRELDGITIGHEPMGILVDVPNGIEVWKAGDRVTIDPTVFCGTCEMCVRGLYEMCTTAV